MNCPICKSSNGKKLGEKNSFEIIKCKKCLTLYTEKLSNSAEYFDYSNYYREDKSAIPDFVYEIYRNTIKGFEPHRQNNRFLDVGCGSGTLLEIGKEMNWDVVGVEVSKPAAENIRKKGLSVFEGTLEEAKFPDNYFDVITCTEVIEHVTNPKEVIKEIARIITPKGILWMTTPHGRGLSGKILGSKWSVVSPPEHLNLFSIKSLKMCLEEAGFKNCRIVSNGFNPVEIYYHLKSKKMGLIQDSQLDSPKATVTKQTSPGSERVKISYQINKWLVSGKNKQKIKSFLNSFLSKTKSGDTIKVWASLE